MQTQTYTHKGRKRTEIRDKEIDRQTDRQTDRQR
jgi:hypothetical protein